MSHLLEVRSLDKHFGGLHVTRNVSFHVSAGERLALIGPNGAGKTTLVNQVSGVLQPDSGSIFLQGEDVTSRSQAQRVVLSKSRHWRLIFQFSGRLNWRYLKEKGSLVGLGEASITILIYKLKLFHCLSG
jgi:ABC-type branched-subunit amino acid transport system ATPase component